MTEDWTKWLTEEERNRCAVGDTWLQEAYHTVAVLRALVTHLKASLEVYYGGEDEGWSDWNKRIRVAGSGVAKDALALTETEMRKRLEVK